MTTVSIIIPAYNVEKYLYDCVNSVINQTYKNLDIILVDDGSVDKTADICDGLAEKDTRIRVFHKQNEGLSAARNDGIEHSKGGFICFLDGDDALHPRFVEKLLTVADEHVCDIAQCDYYTVRDHSSPAFDMKNTPVEIFAGEDSINAYYAHNYSTFNSACMKIYRRNLFADIRFPVGRLREDEFTTWKVLKEASRIVYLHEYLYLYTIRNDSIMGETNINTFLDGMDAFRERAEYYYEHGFLKAASRAYCDLINEIDKALGLRTDDAVLRDQLLRDRDETERLLQKLHYGFIFPFSRIPKDSSVAIYGAGKVGQAYYSQLMECDQFKDVLWVDAYSLRGNEQVESIDKLLLKNYDRIVVAVRDIGMAEDISNTLQSMGINSDKIVWGFAD